MGEITNLLRDTVQAIVGGVKVSFFEYPYPLLDFLERLGEITMTKGGMKP